MTPPLPMTPQPASNVVGAGTWLSGTGNTQTSSTGTAGAIGYAEYRQWLTIEYSRVPAYSMDATDTYFRSLGTLSSTITKNVNSTELHYNITAHTSCTFVSGNFGTSAYHQPQKFQLNAVGYDSQGNAGYGDLTGSANSYVFGPQGAITTTQPYIRRHVTGISDVEYSMTTKGTTHTLQYEFTRNWLRGDDITQPFSFYMNHRHKNDVESYDPSSRPSAEAQSAGARFTIGGGSYSVSSEPGHQNNANGLAQMISFIEEAVADLDPTLNYSGRTYPVRIPILSDGQWWLDPNDYVQRNPYYNSGLHDYS